jgi:tetratricopeptide (TPR) repeat protein
MSIKPPISLEEQEQILQTIEMFEVITQSNPHDCQSLEILKDAYAKLGRQAEAVATTRKLADTYAANGEYSSALLEYEGILRQDPDSKEIQELLHKVEAKLQLSGQTITGERHSPEIEMGIPGMEPTLIRTNATLHDRATLDLEEELVMPTPENDGNDALAKFLSQHRIVAEEVVRISLERVQRLNKSLGPGGLANSLLDEIVHSKAIEMEPLLCSILDRTKFAYVPLEYYDVDRQIVKMLPENLTLGRLIVPFDLVSRTVMVALANPFDALGKEAVQQMLDYNIQWHLASPAAITKVLRDAHRLDARD